MHHDGPFLSNVCSSLRPRYDTFRRRRSRGGSLSRVAHRPVTTRFALVRSGRLRVPSGGSSRSLQMVTHRGKPPKTPACRDKPDKSGQLARACLNCARFRSDGATHLPPPPRATRPYGSARLTSVGTRPRTAGATRRGPPAISCGYHSHGTAHGTGDQPPTRGTTELTRPRSAANPMHRARHRQSATNHSTTAHATGDQTRIRCTRAHRRQSATNRSTALTPPAISRESSARAHATGSEPRIRARAHATTDESRTRSRIAHRPRIPHISGDQSRTGSGIGRPPRTAPDRIHRGS
ncbi:hypothetical protein J2S44_002939 [Catenuloplanes niger]|uniref:Uncharacterized protein n=1 Tax=Catenuloplanes niger TaxID=587534 RepID=A0AAE3ZPR2_9ACTN|nr:hypothetical protein [Catenuloplanes niger]